MCLKDYEKLEGEMGGKKRSSASPPFYKFNWFNLVQPNFGNLWRIELFFLYPPSTSESPHDSLPRRVAMVRIKFKIIQDIDAINCYCLYVLVYCMHTYSN